MKTPAKRHKAAREGKPARKLTSGDDGNYRLHKAKLSERKLRSAISNGSQLLANVDHRSALMRRLADLINDTTSDLGGEDMISTSEQTLVKRAAMLTLQSEVMEGRWVREQDGIAKSRQLDAYMRTVNTLRRTLESLGLGRRARDITTPPNPLRYAAEFDAQRSQAEDVEEVSQ